ncbi:MAG: hypothetical protein NXI29_10875 [bacterium]|nr:hypothetical protein [bacterium]
MMNHNWKTLLLLTCLSVGCGENTNTKVPPQATVEQAQPEKQVASPLSQEAQNQIDWMVRSGFYDYSDLFRTLCLEVFPDEEMDIKLVKQACDQRIQSWQREQKNWPAVTDCDRLDKAFEKLEEQGIISIQFAGNTQSDGYEIFEDTLHIHDHPASVIGYCFFHKQDLERVMDGKDLILSFGPVNPEDEKSRGPEIGKIIQQELEQAGLKVKWDGTFNERIRVTDMVWQKRNPACKPIDFDI